MELYTLNEHYGQEDSIDFFLSALWTERSSGNGDVTLVVPATSDNVELLATGVILGLDDSDEAMMIETQNIKDNILTVTGLSLTQELNSRFIRFTADHNDKSSTLVGSPGYILQFLVQNMAIAGDWLNGVNSMGIVDPSRLKIPYLTIESYDNSLPSITVAISYGPLFDALKNMADTYNIVQKVRVAGPNDIRYQNYIGVDHTRLGTSTELLVRFSSELDNFGNIQEVRTATNYKTHAFAFASGLPAGQTHTAGEEDLAGSYSGFGLRAIQVFADDVTTAPSNLTDILNQRAEDALASNALVGAVDGEFPPNPEYIYGTHYRLGDIVETQGVSGIIYAARVTEYIRSQDKSGEKAYPTLVAV